MNIKNILQLENIRIEEIVPNIIRVGKIKNYSIKDKFSEDNYTVEINNVYYREKDICFNLYHNEELALKNVTDHEIKAYLNNIFKAYRKEIDN